MPSPKTAVAVLLLFALTACLDEQAHYAEGKSAGVRTGSGPSSRPQSRPFGQPAKPEVARPEAAEAPEAAEVVGDPAQPDPEGGAAPEPDHGVFDQILRERVADELVAYQAILQNDRDALASYLGAMAEVDPEALGRDARLAYYINLYNAGMIQAAVGHLASDPSWRPDADGFSVFKEEGLHTKAGITSLDALEHQIIRPQFGEPRVHVALVCGARSCPPLVPYAYTAENLERTLEGNMRGFLKDPDRNPIDHGAKVLKLSKIFEWFKDDFGGDAGLLAYLNRYTEQDVSGYAMEFVEYNWALNSAK